LDNLHHTQTCSEGKLVTWLAAEGVSPALYAVAVPDPTPTSTLDALIDLAASLSQPGADKEAGARELIDRAGGDRAALEAARNVYSTRLHGRSDDWTATGALTLLNRALTDSGWIDPFDWRYRRKP
jgi:hypothetical protein